MGLMNPTAYVRTGGGYPYGRSMSNNVGDVLFSGGLCFKTVDYSTACDANRGRQLMEWKHCLMLYMPCADI